MLKPDVTYSRSKFTAVIPKIAITSASDSLMFEYPPKI